MSHRCISPFAFGNLVYAGGRVVDDDDPILRTHAHHFARVESAGPVRTETASSAPGEVRVVTSTEADEPRPARKRPAKKVAKKAADLADPRPTTPLHGGITTSTFGFPGQQ